MLIIKLSPGMPKRWGGLLPKKINIIPGDNTTFLPLFRPIWGGATQGPGR